MRILVATVAIVLGGCATPKDVIPDGPGLYKIRSTAGEAGLSEADYKAFGIGRATEFCAADGKRAAITVALSADFLAWRGHPTEVRFFCDDKAQTASTPKPSTP